jgi:hypothetical protein
MSERKRSLQRPIYRWEDNSELCVDWIHLAHYRGLVASSCECNIEPLRSMKDGEFLYQLLFLSLLRTELIILLISFFVTES